MLNCFSESGPKALILQGLTCNEWKYSGHIKFSGASIIAGSEPKKTDNNQSFGERETVSIDTFYFSTFIL